MTLAHPQLSPRPFAAIGRAIRVAVLAILLRAGIMGLHHLEQIDYRQFGNLNFFALPVLEVIVLVLVIALSLGTLRRETRFTNAAITVLQAMVINAALRIVDLIRTDEICNSQDFYKFEGFCELIVMQSFCNIPFAIVGILVLLVLWSDNH